MSSAQEWTKYKLTQLKPLEGLKFCLRRYEAPTPDWDHDHCYGCWAKFAGFDGPDIQHEGHLAIVRAQQSPDPEISGLTCIQEPTPNGVTFRWVCRGCFEEFRKVLGFTLEPQ